MDPAKRLQYSVINKLPKANIVLYDENYQPIIRKEELDKGLYNMINKGLIPRGADLTPAFENNGGNPMQINMKIKDDYAKRIDKDEISSKGAMKIDLSKRGTHDDSDGFFITKPREIINIESPILKDMEDNKIQDIQDNNEDTTYRNNMEHQGKKKRVLIISNFQIVKNQEYFLFYNENSDIWGQINYLLEHLGKLFKK